MSAEFTEGTMGAPAEITREAVARKLNELSQLVAEDLTQDQVIDAIAGVAFLSESQLAPINDRLDRTNGCSVFVSYTSGAIDGKRVEFAAVAEDGLGVRYEFLRSDSGIIYGKTGKGAPKIQNPLSPDEAKHIVDLLVAQL